MEVLGSEQQTSGPSAVQVTSKPAWVQSPLARAFCPLARDTWYQSRLTARRGKGTTSSGYPRQAISLTESTSHVFREPLCAQGVGQEERDSKLILRTSDQKGLTE